MAALGKIRSKGPLLVAIIALGLFAFIAGDGFKSCESFSAQKRNQLASVLGEKINAQDYQKYVEEFKEATSTEYAMQQSPAPSDEQIREMAWQNYVNNKMIEAEAKALGLTVTDEEIQNVINEGTHQFLMSVAIPQFHNEKTGRFDANALKQFLANYNNARKNNPQMAEQLEQAHRYWLFKENQLRQTLLMQKYQAMLQAGVLSNPVEAKFAFDAEKIESNVELAYIDYKSINDNEAKVSDADLKAKYDELKERFYIPQEIREIKYIDVKKVASAADRAELQKQMNQYAEELKTAANVEQVVRKSQSRIQYAGVPAAKTIFPTDIANKLDSIAVGSTVGPVENKADNTLNIIRLMGKTSQADSIQYRMIAVGGNTPAEAKKTADSIYTALQGGADFEALAKKYNQTGEKQWVTGNQIYNAALQSKENMPIINAWNDGALNVYQNIALTQGNMIIQVTDRKSFSTRYDVAVIKKTIDFSDETSNEIYNKFNSFVAANRTLADMEKNAQKSGYQVLEMPNVTTSSGYVAGIQGTRDALKWIFEAEEGDISPVYSCGSNTDELLVVVLTKVHPKGYLTLDHPQVKEYVKAEAMNDKKAEIIKAKLNGVNSIAAAKQKGCKVTTVEQITFAAPAMIPALQASEPALSGAVFATPKGKFSSHPVKGNAGVYVFQVTDKKQLPGKFDAKQYAEQVAMQNMRTMFQSIQQDLQRKADVVDNRYLFM